MNLESLITTQKLYLGEVCPFLDVSSLKIYNTVFNVNIMP